MEIVPLRNHKRTLPWWTRYQILCKTAGIAFTSRAVHGLGHRLNNNLEVARLDDWMSSEAQAREAANGAYCVDE